ncbi:hypothetical protein F5888DRAFT_1259735 [Russula emetica]|nr:hypothetical protein F5888DRAFT_1259735 [Russula emetica]
MRSRPTGLQLPQSLLDQLNETSDATPTSRHSRSSLHKPKISRKEARKQSREGKKRRKAEYFSSTDTSSKRLATSPHPDSPPPKKRTVAGQPWPQSSGRQSEKGLSESSSRLTSKKTRAVTLASRTPSSRSVTHPTLPRSQQEVDEDRYIALLEKKLASGKRSKNEPGYLKDIMDDGLGDILDSLDATTPLPVRKHLGHASHGSGLSSESKLGSSKQDEHERRYSDDSKSAELEEWHGFQDTTFDSADRDGESEPALSFDSLPVPVPSSSAGASHYVPPHLREKHLDSNGVEGNVKLTRQLKGLLNKLSEQNIATMIDNIEALYREHRRHDVTASITSFVIESISAHSALLDSYVILLAALISSLYRLVGVEFAAFFVQNVVSSYEHHYSVLSSATAAAAHDATSDPLGKECSNLMVLLSELYNFQVISCVLVYDIIRNLLSAELTEFVVELLLKLLRSMYRYFEFIAAAEFLRDSGQQLRQDDPSALKDIVQIVQSKTSGVEKPSNSRTRFMLETLTSLKNNKIKQATARQVQGNVAEHLKKFLAGLGKTRHLMPHDPLRVSLSDLHSAETRGKWWLVGAAWSGDPLAEAQENSKRASTRQNSDENALLKLAKRQGMNTDIRRSIFVVLMSSDDYVDACERLAQLNLTEVQQREVVRVLVNCCGNEKVYNPYYTFVCQHLCRTSHSYKITLQFCLWDFLRDLGEASVGGAEVLKNLKDNDEGFEARDISSTKMHNVANAYAWWIAKDCVALSIFKPVDFTVLKPRTRDFLSYFFHQLFASSQVSAPVLGTDLPPTRSKDPIEEIFIKATRVQALAMGLVYFLTEMKKTSEEEFVQWASAVAIDTLRTGLDVIPTLQ